MYIYRAREREREREREALHAYCNMYMSSHFYMCPHTAVSAS
jgi:hypothetical protein